MIWNSQRKDKRDRDRGGQYPAPFPHIMDIMEFSDNEPYDIPIGDLLASEDEGGSAKVKPKLFSEEMDACRLAKVTKEKRKKIIMRRRVKVRTDDAKEGGKRWLINEQKMMNGEERRGETVKKSKANNKVDEEEGEYWEGPDEKEEKEKGQKEENKEGGKKSLERRENNLQMCQKDCQVKIENL